MARLLDSVRLIERPKNTPMFIESRGRDEFIFRVAWKYDEALHSVIPIGGKFRYDIDDWNVTWRAWDALPTRAERKAKRWKKGDGSR